MTMNCILREQDGKEGHVEALQWSMRLTRMRWKTAQPGTMLLLGLVVLSLPLGGWLLGYGLSPWIRDWKISELHNKLNGEYLASKPASSHELPSWKNEQRTKNNGSESWSGERGAMGGSN